MLPYEAKLRYAFRIVTNDNENIPGGWDMTLHLARRMEKIKASEIREILKLTQEPDVISFAGGLPAVETFPANDLVEVSARVLKEHWAQALQYSPTEGFPPLRGLIAERMNRRLGTTIEAENILITSGSQDRSLQGLRAPLRRGRDRRRRHGPC